MAKVIPFAQPGAIAQIIKAIDQNKIVILPTDTIYGFLFKEENQAKIRMLKNRDQKPFLYLIAHINQLTQLNVNYQKYQKLLALNWPGPFTFLLPHAKKCSGEETGNQKIGVRLPDHPGLRQIILQVGQPLMSTSINISGQESLHCIDIIIEQYEAKADLIVTDPDFSGQTASAVIDYNGTDYQIIREGLLELKC